LQGKELRVEKKKVNKYPIAFRKMALERLKTCPSATELSAELGIHRTLLYKWRDKIEPVEDGPGRAGNSGERELRKQIRELKRALGEKVLEVDFFKGALQKVEARRQNSGGSGGTASSSKSGSE
jgi:transposase